MNRRPLAPCLAAVLLLGTACSPSDPPEAGRDAAGAQPSSTSGPGSDDSSGDDHGAVDGAEEVAEPPLHLLTLDAAGGVGLLDLVDETATVVGTIEPPVAAWTDGRYVFAATSGGVEVVDSGMWTWDHGDHFHYYRSAPELVGAVPGRGVPVVAHGRVSTAGSTGMFFPESGEAVLLDNAALDAGRVEERFRLDLGGREGLVAPLGDGAVVTVPDRSGRVRAVRRVAADGTAVDGSHERCLDARGSISTAVGLAINCADGALLLVEDGDEWVPERIPYPQGVSAPPATDFRAREGRPTVAALAGRVGFWLLDTRERRWDLVRTDGGLLQVVASDDEEGHVVALDRAGRVRVYLAGSGEQVAITRPLVAAPAGARHPVPLLVVDDQRAYLNDPEGGRVLEIDYADGARVARELVPPTAARFFAEVGR
ncbi:ABC transporter [Nocardioides xinjiangensis]|uniref:ABC transporter n=1 Tax=Nocardioides xinjiangensis TaxID=2817376 RepID=UPI001B30E88D|nr:ABC transporter [Nocardioides sp. SYSU D00514]